jgi:hypothetical protein
MLICPAYLLPLPVQISLPSTMRMTAPDGTVYVAVQMHYHWGGASSEVSGSEHTIDGIRRVTEVCEDPSSGLSLQAP